MPPEFFIDDGVGYGGCDLRWRVPPARSQLFADAVGQKPPAVLPANQVEVA